MNLALEQIGIRTRAQMKFELAMRGIKVPDQTAEEQNDLNEAEAAAMEALIARRNQELLEHGRPQWKT